MTEENNENEITEKIKIIATDDEKIKSFGELLTNDSSRAILQLLFNEELTALQIAEKTGISLQLVKYHIIKLQDLGVVKVTKVEKNSKSQDMKFYSASKFSMVIVPPKYSEKTKESKLLVRSFKHIYKIAGFGIASGVSGLMSLSLMQASKSISVETELQINDSQDSIDDSLKSSETGQNSGEVIQSKEPSPGVAQDFAIEESMELHKRGIEEAEQNITTSSGIQIFDFGDLAISFVVLALILGGIAGFFVYKSMKHSKKRQII